MNSIDRYHAKKVEGKKGEKGHKFNEEGKFKKGHSVRGKHYIHKKDESGKKKDYFDEGKLQAFVNNIFIYPILWNELEAWTAECT